MGDLSRDHVRLGNLFTSRCCERGLGNIGSLFLQLLALVFVFKSCLMYTSFLKVHPAVSHLQMERHHLDA